MSEHVLMRAESLQKQLLHILKDRMVNGDYPPDSRFPSENELAVEFNVSRATVRSVVSALEAKGLIYRRQGVGSYVSRISMEIVHPIGKFVNFVDLIENSDFKPGYKVERVNIDSADKELAVDLIIEENSLILRTEVIFTADDTPVIYCINSMPLWMLGESTAAQVIENPHMIEPFDQFLTDQCHQQIVGHSAVLWADLVQNFEMPISDFNAISPILVLKSIGYNDAMRPVFQSLSAYPDKRVKFSLSRQTNV